MTSWLDPDEQRVWKQYLDSHRMLLAALERQLQADCGLSFADYEVLVALSEAPDRTVRMSELAQTRQSTRSGMTRAVIRLEGLGYVVRSPSADDGRGTNARLTPAGFALLSRSAPGHVQAVRDNLFSLLDAQELAALDRTSAVLIEHLQAPPNSRE